MICQKKLVHAANAPLPKTVRESQVLILQREEKNPIEQEVRRPEKAVKKREKCRLRMERERKKKVNNYPPNRRLNSCVPVCVVGYTLFTLK
jgi:hypothetical protein